MNKKLIKENNTFKIWLLAHGLEIDYEDKEKLILINEDYGTEIIFDKNKKNVKFNENQFLYSDIFIIYEIIKELENF